MPRNGTDPVSRFVVRAITWLYVRGVLPPEIAEMPSPIACLEFAKRNKMLLSFAGACRELGVKLPPAVERLEQELRDRRQAQLEAISELLDLSARLGVDVLFFKTFRGFDYTPDDVDVLIRQPSRLHELQDALCRRGYRVYKVGTPEIVLRRGGGRAYVDLDIHLSLSVGFLHLLETERLWRDLCFLSTDSELRVPVLGPGAEAMREAAYSLLKDMSLSVPGFLQGLLLDSDTMHEASLLAKNANLDAAYTLFGLSLALVAREFGIGTKVFQSLLFRPSIPPRIRNGLVRDFSLWRCLPYRYPFRAVAYAYAAKIGRDLAQGQIDSLAQSLRNPFAKGTGLALDYLSDRLTHRRGNHAQVSWVSR